MGDLSLKVLHNAVVGTASAVRIITRLEPAGGKGDKVFPPTYEGGKYALEDRLINGQTVPTVLLDSVQSQANRLEEALLQAIDPEKPFMPLIRVAIPRGDGHSTTITAL